MASKYEYVSEEELNYMVRKVQRLKKDQRDEQKWLNLRSDSSETNKESVGINPAQNLCSESLEKNGRSSGDLREMQSSAPVSQGLSPEEGFSIDADCIRLCRLEISAILDGMMLLMDNLPVPEDDKDLARRMLRSSEFTVMFTRNYLYQLQRNETEVKERQNLLLLSPHHHFNHLNKFHQKLAAAYRDVLHAVQVYLRHIPKTVASALPGKLKGLLAHICHLEMAHDNLDVLVDEDNISSEVMMEKCEKLLALGYKKKEDSEKRVRASYHGPRVGCKDRKKNRSKLKIKKPVMKTKEFPVTRNLRDKKYPDRSTSSARNEEGFSDTRNLSDEKRPRRSCSCTRKEDNRHQVVSENERYRTETSKQKPDVNSMGDNNICGKKKNKCKKSNEYLMNGGKKAKELCNEVISRNEELCHRSGTPVTDAKTRKHLKEKIIYKNVKTSLTNVEKCKKSNVYDLVNKAVKSEVLEKEEISRKQKACLLNEIPSPSFMTKNVNAAEEEVPSSDVRCRPRSKEPSVKKILETRETSHEIIISRRRHEQRRLEEVSRPAVCRGSKHPAKDSCLHDAMKQQTYLNITPIAEVSKKKHQKKILFKNINIPWTAVEKLCDDFMEESMQAVSKEMYQIISGMAKAMIENEFKY
ncbi:uncharacterized protein LOC134527937 isoform X2 [Bacillus rossius redtenbacheri]|uniref:uncharacterized protein LOC134527937 isoform X2 n=1 Tax=Bacillus rossius redtenbacheri TaxID=93214 RepID=UPI002FDD7B16